MDEFDDDLCLLITEPLPVLADNASLALPDDESCHVVDVLRKNDHFCLSNFDDEGDNTC